MICTVDAHCPGYYNVLQESNIFIGSKYSRMVPSTFGFAEAKQIAVHTKTVSEKSIDVSNYCCILLFLV